MESTKQEPIRIAQVIGKWVGGGVEAVVMNYYRHIDKEKIQFDFICDEDSTNIPYEEIKKLGGKVILIPPYQKVFRYHKQLKRTLKEGNYKIVHSHINTLSVFSLFAAKCAKVPVRIAHSHSTTNKKEKKKNLMKQVLKPFSKLFATDYMCCSELAGRWLFGNKLYDKGKIYLLNNAIDLHKFEYNEKIREEVRKELNIDEKAFVVGHIGRFVEQKNHSFLIDIFDEFHKQKQDSVLMLVGQGPLQEEIKAKVERLGLKESVLFLGQRNDANRLYQAMDVFVLPSLYEGLGMVLIEAQTAGAYCFASTEVPEIAKVTENVKFLKLVDSPKKWAKEILKMGNYQRAGAKEIVSKRGYDIKEEVKKLEKYYLKECGENTPIYVLQMGMTDNLGGIETFLMNYYRNIDKNKVQFDFVNIYPNDLCFQNEINKLGGRVYKVSSYYKHPIRYIREVKNIIKENRYKIIHCNMNSAAMLYPLVAAKLAKAKVIIAHSHNSSSDKGLIKEILHNVNKRFIPLLANYYFACSEKAGHWFFSKKIMKSEKFRVIYNAIDVEKYQFNDKVREKQRKQLNIKEDAIVLGHVGRFNKQKNHTFLIDVFWEYQKMYQNAILILVGIGPLEEEIKKKVLELGIEKSVIFLGQRSNVNELYQTMDVFLLPSLYEGLGTVLIEAQTAGTYCFASTEVPKIAQVTGNMQFLKLTDSPKKWAEEISKISNYKRIRTKEIVSEQGYDIEKEAKRLQEKYLESFD